MSAPALASGKSPSRGSAIITKADASHLAVYPHRTSSHIRRLAFAFIVVLGLGACSGGTATPVPSPGSPPLGTYALKITNLPESLTLVAGGQYKMTVQGFDITGTWSGQQGQLSFTETAGGACTGALGTYTWSYTGTLLLMTLVKDACDVRPADIANPGGWVKQP